jgi:hypothetical protein
MPIEKKIHNNLKPHKIMAVGLKWSGVVGGTINVVEGGAKQETTH